MIYVLLLVAVTAVWGWTFVLVKDAISQYPTLPFLGIRFILAALVMVIAVRRLPTRAVLRVGIPIGLALAAGYLLQTVGLQTTSAGNAGLITGLFVVFTPLLEGLLGTHVPRRTFVAAVVALCGASLLAGAGGTGFHLGDVLVVGCALAFGAHIVMLGRWGPGLPAAPLAMVQMLVAGLLFAGAGAPQMSVPPTAVWPALAVTAVLASALGFLIQTWAQMHISASRTALVLATEPAWALLAAVVLAGQRLGPLQGVGALLVLVAIIGHEVLATRGVATAAAKATG